MVSRNRIEIAIRRLNAVKHTVDIGYPYFDVPQTLAAVLKLLRELRSQYGK